jgi:hypothetical protein
VNGEASYGERSKMWFIYPKIAVKKFFCWCAKYLPKEHLVKRIIHCPKSSVATIPCGKLRYMNCSYLAQVPPENPWSGSNGAEGNYGLWYLNDQGKYTDKTSP